MKKLRLEQLHSLSWKVMLSHHQGLFKGELEWKFLFQTIFSCGAHSVFQSDFSEQKSNEATSMLKTIQWLPMVIKAQFEIFPLVPKTQIICLSIIFLTWILTIPHLPLFLYIAVMLLISQFLKISKVFLPQDLCSCRTLELECTFPHPSVSAYVISQGDCSWPASLEWSSLLYSAVIHPCWFSAY